MGVALVVYGLAVSPILRTPYVSDDTINSLAWANAHFESDGTYWTYTELWIRGWWTNHGRFFPLSYIHGYAIFWVFPSVVAYKVIQFAYAIVAALSFAVMLRQMRVGARTTALAVLAVTATTSFVHARDGLLGFGALMPFLLTQLFLSLAAFAAWQRTRRRLLLGVSLVLFIAASLTYESAHLVGLMFVAVALAGGRRLRDALRAAAPFLVVMVAGIALGLWGRHRAGGGGEYAATPELGAAVTTFAKQLFTTLPLTATGAVDAAANLGPWALGLGLLAAAVTVWIIVRTGDPVRPAGPAPTPAAGARRAWALPVGGLVWCALMAGPIALTARYQVELTWHEGHVQTYAQYFGFGLIVAALAALVARALGRRAGAAVMALVIAAGTATAAQRNLDWVRGVAPERDARAAAERALRDGLVAEVPPDGVVLDTMIPTPWLSPPAFYYQYARRPVAAQRPTVAAAEGWVDAQRRFPGPCNRNPASGARWAGAVTPASGVHVAALACINPTRGGYDTVVVTGLADPNAAILVGRYRTGLDLGAAFRHPVARLSPRRRGDALVLRVPRTGRAIDPGSLSFVRD